MIDNPQYNFGFTAGAAMLNETRAMAEAYLDCGCDWERTKEKVLKENILSKEKVSTAKRYFSLIKERLETLNTAELHAFVNGSVSTQRTLVLLAICKAYSFIYDFINEYVRECFYNLQEKVTHTVFNEFYNEKKYIHPELENVTEKSVYKMRQVLFRILEQTEIIESANDGTIRRPYLPPELEEMIVKDDAKWLAVFLYSNNEISNLKEVYNG